MSRRRGRAIATGTTSMAIGALPSPSPMCRSGAHVSPRFSGPPKVWRATVAASVRVVRPHKIGALHRRIRHTCRIGGTLGLGFHFWIILFDSDVRGTWSNLRPLRTQPSWLSPTATHCQVQTMRLTAASQQVPFPARSPYREWRLAGPSLRHRDLACIQAHWLNRVPAEALVVSARRG